MPTEQQILQQDQKVKHREAILAWREEKKQLRGLENKVRVDELRATELKKLREKAYPVDTDQPFAKLAVPPPQVKKILSKEEQETVGQRFFAESDFNTEVSPSIQTQLKGTTYLKDSLKIQEDTTDTFFINEFIIQKMVSGKLKDTKENYDYVLDKLLGRVNINRRHNSDYVLKRISLYLRNGAQEDDTLILSIMGRKNNARFRR